MKKVLIFIFLIYGFVFLAQPPQRFYTKFGGNGDDVGYSCKQTLDGQYIVAGSTSSFGSTDVYLVKVDSMGLPIWSKNIGGVNFDVGKSVVQLPDSGFVIAGYTNSFGAGGYDAYLIRTDKNGNLVWQRTFGGPDWDFANDVVLTPNGNIAVVGNTSSFGHGQKDGMVLIYDYSGNIIWQKFHGGLENEELRSIISTNDGYLATVGYTESRGEINGDGYFLKLNLNGDTIFTRTYGGPGLDYANDIIQKSYNEYMIAGAKTYSDNPHTQSLMFSFSAIGDSLWERHLLKNNEDECFQSVTNSPLLYKITAFTRSINFPVFKRQGQIFTSFPVDGFEYQINESGGTEDEYEYSIEPTRDGGYVNVGSTRSFGSIGTDVYFIKRDSAVLNYSSIVGIHQIEQTHVNIILHKDQTIYLDFQNHGALSVEIFNLNGSLIKEYFVDRDKFEFDISNYASSVYIIEIKYRDGEIHREKFIK